jgi:ketosteroid isomerase-like protein
MKRVRKACIMRVEENISLVLEAFEAVERRDAQRLSELYHPDVEFHWPPSLPYGGTFRRREIGALQQATRWSATWDALQPTQAERQMSPRVVATAFDEVVVLWRQRALSPAGERFEGEVLGLYQVRDGKFARAQMFYFDTTAVLSFLERATAQGTAREQGSTTT